MAEFRWHPSDPPPRIEGHSRAKLSVLRSYLSAYFDRLNVSPHREEFKLDLVDGFCGGGTFTDVSGTVPGSPLIMLEEAEAANDRLNRNRAKHLRIDCRFYFVDKEQTHVDHLNMRLAERGYGPNDERVVVRHGLFEDALDGILAEIHRRQPRAGRSIFLLDQTGFAQVELELVNRIFRELPAAEVILTFAADALINHLAVTPEIVKATAPLDLSPALIEKLIQDRQGHGGRALAQRSLRPHILERTGATYCTPFFIRPELSRRSLWFLHLSKRLVARNVMVQQHWRIHNTFEHDGSGGLDMMGWDPLKESATMTLFNFGELDESQMRNQLLDSMPRELFALAADTSVAVEAVHHQFANRTAARFEDLDDVILQLREEGEIHILGPSGKTRSRSLKRLRSNDRIAFTGTLFLPGISRVR